MDGTILVRESSRLKVVISSRGIPSHPMSSLFHLSTVLITAVVKCLGRGCNGKARFVELKIAFARGSAPGANLFKSIA